MREGDEGKPADLTKLGQILAGTPILNSFAVLTTASRQDVAHAGCSEDEMICRKVEYIPLANPSAASGIQVIPPRWNIYTIEQLIPPTSREKHLFLSLLIHICMYYIHTYTYLYM